MAIVKGLSLEAIKSLKGAITFSTYKGLTIAKAHMRKIGPNRSPRVTVMNNRYKVAAYYLHTLGTEVIDLWKGYTNGTDWTWKDAFISAFLKSWAENNAPPIVVTELSFNWGSPTAELTFDFADWYYGFDFGYGTDGYGTCPYGTPTGLTEDQPHEIVPEYEIGYTQSFGKPYKTFYGSPRNLGCIKPIRLQDRFSRTPSDYTTRESINLGRTRRYTEVRTSGWWPRPTCEEAFTQAWNEWWTNPLFTGTPHADTYLGAYVRPDGAQFEAFVISNTHEFHIDYENVIDPWNWWTIDHIELVMDWTVTYDFDPWKLTVLHAGKTTKLTAGETPITIPHPLFFDPEETMFFSYVVKKPDSPCGHPPLATNSIDYTFRLQLHWKPQLKKKSNRDLNPPAHPFAIRLVGNPSRRHVTSPPVNVLEGP